MLKIGLIFIYQPNKVILEYLKYQELDTDPLKRDRIIIPFLYESKDDIDETNAFDDFKTRQIFNIIYQYFNTNVSELEVDRMNNTLYFTRVKCILNTHSDKINFCNLRYYDKSSNKYNLFENTMKNNNMFIILDIHINYESMKEVCISYKDNKIMEITKFNYTYNASKFYKIYKIIDHALDGSICFYNKNNLLSYKTEFKFIYDEYNNTNPPIITYDVKLYPVSNNIVSETKDLTEENKELEEQVIDKKVYTHIRIGLYFELVSSVEEEYNIIPFLYKENVAYAEQTPYSLDKVLDKYYSLVNKFSLTGKKYVVTCTKEDGLSIIIISNSSYNRSDNSNAFSFQIRKELLDNSNITSFVILDPYIDLVNEYFSSTQVLIKAFNFSINAILKDEYKVIMHKTLSSMPMVSELNSVSINFVKDKHNDYLYTGDVCIELFKIDDPYIYDLIYKDVEKEEINIEEKTYDNIKIGVLFILGGTTHVNTTNMVAEEYTVIPFLYKELCKHPQSDKAKEYTLATYNKLSKMLIYSTQYSIGGEKFTNSSYLKFDSTCYTYNKYNAYSFSIRGKILETSNLYSFVILNAFVDIEKKETNSPIGIGFLNSDIKFICKDGLDGLNKISLDSIPLQYFNKIIYYLLLNRSVTYCPTNLDTIASDPIYISYTNTKCKFDYKCLSVFGSDVYYKLYEITDPHIKYSIPDINKEKEIERMASTKFMQTVTTSGLLPKDLMSCNFNAPVNSTTYVFKIGKGIEMDTSILYDKIIKHLFTIKDVKFNGNRVIVFWTDNTKTIVAMQDDESKYDVEKALFAAYTKKIHGYFETAKKRSMNTMLDKWIEKFKKEEKIIKAQIKKVKERKAKKKEADNN